MALAVIFDLDVTLVDTAPDLTHATNHVLQSEPEAMARLARQKGQRIELVWDRVQLQLTPTPAGLLERGRFAKLFRNGVDPIQLYISIAALCYFYLSNNQTLSTIFGQDLMSPKALAQRLSHMQELVLGYVLR